MATARVEDVGSRREQRGNGRRQPLARIQLRARLDAVLGWYEGGGAADAGVPEHLGDPDSFDVSEERGELEDFGEGRVGSVNRLVYTSRESGEVAHARTARLVYTVRAGKIVRYELESLES